MGVSDNIRALLVDNDMSQGRLAEIAGADRSTVNKWINEDRRPLKRHLQALCDYFGLIPDDITSDYYGLAAKLSGRYGMPVYSSGDATVPLMSMGRVHAGSLTDEDATSERVEVPASVLRNHPRATALMVEGDCMNRVAPEGMAVLIDPDLTPENGSIVVAEVEGYKAVMRRWYRGSGTLLLVADSYTEHEDIVLRWDDGPVRVLGVVVWIQSAKEMV